MFGDGIIINTFIYELSIVFSYMHFAHTFDSFFMWEQNKPDSPQLRSVSAPFDVNFSTNDIFSSRD